MPKVGEKYTVNGKNVTVLQVVHTPTDFQAQMKGEGSTAGVGSDLQIKYTDCLVRDEEGNEYRVRVPNQDNKE